MQDGRPLVGRLMQVVFDPTEEDVEDMIWIDEENAPVLDKTTVSGIEEYAQGRLLLGLAQKFDNLFDLNLQTGEIHKISTPNIQNPDIESIQPFGNQKGVDVDNFPFLVAKGMNAAYLVNIQTRKSQILMTTVPYTGGMKKTLQFLDEVEQIDKEDGPKQLAVRCIYATHFLGFQSSKVF